MKPSIVFHLLAASLLLCANPSQAALAVVDPALIKTNLISAKQALAEQILHGKQQIDHIRKVIQQIKQIDDYLTRFGDPKKVTLATFNEAVGFLNGLELSKSSEDIVSDIDHREIFRSKPNSPYKGVGEDIVVDGKAVATRSAEVFTPEVAARRSLDHYREVRSSALEQRKRIKAEIGLSLQQLRTASTSSEVAKLNTLIRALEAQLSANDREIEFAADEVITRYFHNKVEEEVQAKARVQQKRHSLKVATEKDILFYRFPTKPLYFKR